MLVDPGKLTLNFDPSSSPDPSEGTKHAVGVVTVVVTATPRKSKEKLRLSSRWLSLRLGKKKYQQQLVLQDGVCRKTYSFLVSDLQNDVVCACPVACDHVITM